MTKERRLAIEMWQNIRDMMSASPRLTRASIVGYKWTFCADHDLRWVYSCWFCQYMSSCSECPLKCCSSGLYGIVLADYKEKDARVAACDGIIKALRGEG